MLHLSSRCRPGSLWKHLLQERFSPEPSEDVIVAPPTLAKAARMDPIVWNIVSASCPPGGSPEPPLPDFSAARLNLPRSLDRCVRRARGRTPALLPLSPVPDRARWTGPSAANCEINWSCDATGVRPEGASVHLLVGGPPTEDLPPPSDVSDDLWTPPGILAACARRRVAFERDELRAAPTRGRRHKVQSLVQTPERQVLTRFSLRRRRLGVHQRGTLVPKRVDSLGSLVRVNV